jgi:methyltransferase (TIGR00027 family)
VRVFEVDRPGASEWKRARLAELGWRVPVLVPVDFETDSWRDRIVAAGFDATKPAVVASTGVSMYLTREATAETLRQIATLAPGSTLAMTFLVTVDLMEPEDRKAFEWAAKGAAASGTPLATLYRPTELLEMARDFKTAEHVRGQSGEDFLVART